VSEIDVSAHEAYEVDGQIIVAERDPEIVEAAADMARPGGELDSTNRVVARAIASWAEDIQGSSSRSSQALFERDKYVTPAKIYKQMEVAYSALDDDIVANALDVTEALAFNRVRAISDDEDTQNVWNQILGDLNMDAWIRQAWSELFTVSHYYGIRWWGAKEYTVQGVRDKRKSRKKYNIIVPTELGFLDPMRVVPIAPDMFGNYRLAWIADEGDMKLYDSTDAATQSDDVVKSLFVSHYTPSKSEEKMLSKQGVETDRLLELNDEFVWMGTQTKPPYERWPRIRLKSIFPLLDLKTQLRQMDRAVLLSGTNFIVLVKKGTDAHPVKKASEMESVVEQVRTVSRSPVIVSDHRLEIEIITPDLTAVLNSEKWNTIDSRIAMRLWGTFVSNPTEGRDTSLTLGRVIARGISSRRHMLKRDIERNIFKEVRELNEDDFGENAKLEFTPQRIELEMDEAIANIIQELRDRGDLSRETTLNELGFDQETEAARREYEDKKWKKVFEPPTIPFDSPQKTQGTPQGDGRKSGPNKEPKKKTEGTE